jgi:phage shock protein PspC (stress-responsive transcriptional regulator)
MPLKLQSIFRKLSSRKFWMAAAGVVTGIAMAFGVDASAVATVAGAVTAVISVAAYIAAEGKIDAAAAQTAARSICAAAQTVAQESGHGGD